mmetsp:Transcript_23906/g.75770  ORF Transcript_23906/g.75770 Transcript_23906/m.75770 type:complete len:247 (+) Transcript_23906:333-1073(+)
MKGRSCSAGTSTTAAPSASAAAAPSSLTRRGAGAAPAPAVDGRTWPGQLAVSGCMTQTIWPGVGADRALSPGLSSSAEAASFEEAELCTMSARFTDRSTPSGLKTPPAPGGVSKKCTLYWTPPSAHLISEILAKRGGISPVSHTTWPSRNSALGCGRRLPGDSWAAEDAAKDAAGRFLPRLALPAPSAVPSSAADPAEARRPRRPPSSFAAASVALESTPGSAIFSSSESSFLLLRPQRSRRSLSE